MGKYRRPGATLVDLIHFTRRVNEARREAEAEGRERAERRKGKLANTFCTLMLVVTIAFVT